MRAAKAFPEANAMDNFQALKSASGAGYGLHRWKPWLKFSPKVGLRGKIWSTEAEALAKFQF